MTLQIWKKGHFKKDFLVEFVPYISNLKLSKGPQIDDQPSNDPGLRRCLVAASITAC